MSNIWTVPKPTKHIKGLCRELGIEYSIVPFDLERVIYRNFGNGYDVEISRVNTTSIKKKAVIYLWKDTNRIIKIVEGVPQADIGKWVEWLRDKAESLTPEDFAEDGFLKEERTIYVEVPQCRANH